MLFPLVNLNVFTNVTSTDPRHCLVPEAVNSFFHCFGNEFEPRQVITRIFVDPKPHRDLFDQWVATIQGLRATHLEVIKTNGLNDGFWRSVRMSECDYAVQLEHDFVFLKGRIAHPLSEIIDEMKRSHLNFVRFNKRRNVQVGYDFFMELDAFAKVPLCRVSGRSNNPQIIHVPYYQHLDETIPFIDLIGLEGGICRRSGGGHVYGAPGFPRTVQHLDGRRVRVKDSISRALWFARQWINARVRA